MDARSGPVHDMLVSGERAFVDGLEGMARAAQRRGEVDGDVDVGQLAFELQAAIDLANYHYVLFRDERDLRRARAVIAGAIDRARAR